MSVHVAAAVYETLESISQHVIHVNIILLSMVCVMLSVIIFLIYHLMVFCECVYGECVCVCNCACVCVCGRGGCVYVCVGGACVCMCVYVYVCVCELHVE